MNRTKGSPQAATADKGLFNRLLRTMASGEKPSEKPSTDQEKVAKSKAKGKAPPSKKDGA